MRFFKNARKEFRKVHWVSRKEMFSDFWYILAWSVLLVIFFGIIDVIMNVVL